MRKPSDNGFFKALARMDRTGAYLVNKFGYMLLIPIAIILALVVMPRLEQDDFDKYFLELKEPCKGEQACESRYLSALHACWDKNRIYSRASKVTDGKNMKLCIESELAQTR